MQFKLAERAAGILLHVTSLPGGAFLGDLGAEAHAFVDFLAGAGQRWWQMLPVNPIGEGNSPYSTVSSFAGEPLLIDLEDLVRSGWLRRRDVQRPKAGAARLASYDAARAYRLPRLRQAYGRAAPQLGRLAAFREFRQREGAWLEDYALFGALAAHQGTLDWSAWPEPLRRREPRTLAAARQELQDQVTFLEFCQFVFERQWRQLKTHAARQGIGLLGDLPIFVSHRSADVWAHPRYFRLSDAGRPTVVAGCPPDAFNADGQLWGNALYDWPALQADGFSWWLDRLGRLFELFDAVRLDHFIGFSRYWEIDAKAQTARGGKWQPAPGDAFFAAVVKAIKAPQLIAEDLGAVTPAVRALRDKFGLPGMKVLQFAFDGGDEANHHKPHRLPPASVAYTGTHDNETTRGWYESLRRRATRRAPGAARELATVNAYLGTTSPRNVAWSLIRAAYASPANLVVIPMQDVLGQGSGARMNVPGVAKGNWRYRVERSALGKETRERLAALARAYDR